MDQNRPGNCFASMIGPLVGFPVKGVIFHQGYNNCFNGTEGTMLYRQVFPEMIKAWREAFDDPQLPFGILSLCTEGPVQTLDNYCEMMANTGPFIREAQYQTFLELYRGGDKHIGFTSTYDLRRRWYHPQLKIPAGERIARWALATQYGFDGAIRWKPPLVESSEAAGDKLVIHLDEPASAVDDGGPILGFAVAGKDRKFHPAQAVHQVTGQDDRGREKTDKRILELSSPMVPAPVHFRYAWARSPLGNLQAERMTDIPFATQRSDNWSLENVPTGVHAEPVQGKWTRPQQRAILDALREQDIQRIIAEAETLQR
jgi:sialate O-acetylesterase